MMRAASSLFVAMVFALTTLPPLAMAQDQSEKKRLAKVLVRKANGHYRSQDYDAALSAYASAYDLYPSPKITFNIAKALQTLERWEEAQTRFERFLGDTADPVSSPRYRAAQRALREIEKKLQISIPEPEVGPVLEGALSPAAPVPVEEEGPQRSPSDNSVGVPSLSSAGSASSFSLHASTPAKSPDVEGGSVFSKWWFWTIVGVATAAAVGTDMHLSKSDEGFVPRGELDNSSLDGWARL